jgi:hypothetical protein
VFPVGLRLGGGGSRDSKPKSGCLSFFGSGGGTAGVSFGIFLFLLGLPGPLGGGAAGGLGLTNAKRPCWSTMLPLVQNSKFEPVSEPRVPLPEPNICADKSQHSVRKIKTLCKIFFSAARFGWPNSGRPNSQLHSTRV